MVALQEPSAIQTAHQRLPVLRATEVTRRFGAHAAAVDALRGVSLAVDRGEFVAMMGPSGSGKSTLLHILGGLDRPTSGEVFLEGTPISRLTDDELTLLRRSAIGFVFQAFNLLPMLTAEENVILPLRLLDREPESGWIDELLVRVGLTDRRHHRPADLSGGEAQRVAVARALVTRPAIVIADEPTGNLDTRTGREILDVLRSSASEYGQTILMATHEPAVSTVADRIVLLRDGTVVDELEHVSSAELIAAIGAPSRPRRLSVADA
jgi:putative ABC transport system ATP-binding protein